MAGINRKKKPMSFSIFSVLKLFPKIAYWWVKLYEKYDGVIGKLVRATIFELGPDFRSRLLPETPKIAQWQIQVEQMSAHTYTFVQYWSQISFDIHSFYLLPSEHWQKVNRFDWTHSFMFATMFTFVECTHSFVFGQTVADSRESCVTECLAMLHMSRLLSLLVI